MKLYRDISIRVYGAKNCQTIDKLRKKGVNITELITKAIKDYQK